MSATPFGAVLTNKISSRFSLCSPKKKHEREKLFTPKALMVAICENSFLSHLLFFCVMVLHFNDLWLAWLFLLPWKPTYCVTEMCADEKYKSTADSVISLNHIVCACVKSNLYYFSSPFLRELISYARIGWFEPPEGEEEKKALAARPRNYERWARGWRCEHH